MAVARAPSGSARARGECDAPDTDIYVRFARLASR